MLNADEVMKDLEKQIAAEEAANAEESGATEISKKVVDKAQESVEEEDEDIVDSSEEEEGEEIEDGISEPELKDDKARHAWKKLKDKIKSEKEANKRFQDQIRELSEKQARTDGYVEGLKESKVAPARAVEDPEPDKSIDREEWLEWALRQATNKLSDTANQVESLKEITLAQSARMGISAIETRYRATNSTYDDALQFVKERQKALIKVDYPDASDEQIDAHLEREKSKIFQSSKAPCEKIVNMAKALGYEAKKLAKVDDAKKLLGNTQVDFKKLNQNMKKNTSLIGGSQQQRKAPITSEAIVDLSLAQAMGLSPEAWSNAESSLETD